MSVKDDIKVLVREPLTSQDFDWDFPAEIAKRHGGERLNYCYQCGCCAGGCPVGKLVDLFKPRHLIRMTLMGLRKEVLSSNAIWLCASCYTCQERCPMGIEIADLMLAIRNIASIEGNVPQAIVEQAFSLIENGRVTNITSLVERRRASLNLPSISPASVEAVKKISELTGFNKLVQRLRGRS